MLGQRKDVLYSNRTDKKISGTSTADGKTEYPFLFSLGIRVSKGYTYNNEILITILEHDEEA